MKKEYMKPEMKVFNMKTTKFLCGSSGPNRSYNSNDWDGDEDDEFL